MTETQLRARKKTADTLRDIEHWHDELLSFIEADEKARDVRHDDYRMAVGMLSHLAAQGTVRGHRHS